VTFLNWIRSLFRREPQVVVRFEGRQFVTQAEVERAVADAINGARAKGRRLS
jgi:ribosomal protein S24E